MEKVIRICELTGRVTTIAEGVDTETAKKIVIEKSKADVYGQYMRIVKK